MRKYYILILFLMSILACTKKPGILYLDAKIKEQFYFKKGSYWIYRDSISGRVDSFYLESVEFTNDSTYIYALYDKRILEKMTINIFQTSLSVPYSDTPIWDFSLLQRNNYFFKSNYQKGKIKILTYSILQGYMDVGLEKELDVFGKTFTDVPSFKSPNSLYYLKEGIGYLKMRLNYDDGASKINEVWELLRWHVVK